MTDDGQSGVPLRDVEVRAHIAQRRFGLRRHHGWLEYRLLPTRGHAFGSFWMEYAKQDGFSGWHPLCKARTRQRLMEHLLVEANRLGHVAKWTEVVDA